MKKYDLMHQINIRGTFMVSKYCLPHLLKSSNAHILNLSPPLSLKPHWFSNHLAYTMAKYGMSMCVLGMAEEFRGKVAVNALWPKTGIATAAVMNILGGDESMRKSRNTDIMADSAYLILTSDRSNSGNFYIVPFLICRTRRFSENTESLISSSIGSSRTSPSRRRSLFLTSFYSDCPLC
jgi:citronellol/citronellal dehydrogenase